MTSSAFSESKCIGSLGLFAFACLVLFSISSTASSANEFVEKSWSEGNSSNSGANRKYFDKAAFLRWRKSSGDWYDSTGKLYGLEPFSETTIQDKDQEQEISWDVKNLVESWLNGKVRNEGFFLISLNSKKVIFHSRENGDKRKSPTLRLSYKNGKSILLKTIADTMLNASTHKSLGKRKAITVGRAMIKFDLNDIPKGEALSGAELVLHTTKKQFGSTDVGIFRPATVILKPPAPKTDGIASKYIRDKGIASDKQVIFSEDFESTSWKENWSGHFKNGKFDRITSDKKLNFEKLSGAALKVVVLKGKLFGSSFRYKFREELGFEPEEAYMRYYLRLAPDWKPTLQGGKLPGLAGTYGKGGWGGRTSDGYNGWSMRGLFRISVQGDSDYAGKNPIGTYAYHADMDGTYGDHWVWADNGLGLLSNDRWYCIETYVKLNDVGKSNGVYKAWVDGRLALEKRNIQYRKTDALKIETVWLSVYHGGRKAAPQNHSLYVDNIVVSKSYIGPMRLQ